MDHYMLSFAGFLPLIVMLFPYAIGAYFLAPRLGKNKFLWAILCLIPVVNLFFLIYMMFKIMFFVIDSLNEIKGTVAGKSPL